MVVCGPSRSQRRSAHPSPGLVGSPRASRAFLDLDVLEDKLKRPFPVQELFKSAELW